MLPAISRWACVLLIACLAGVAHGETITARIPPTLTFDDALNDYFLQGELSDDRIIEIALANDPSVWHQYQEALGDSFKAEQFIGRYRRSLRDQLLRHDKQARYRATGELLVEAVGQGDRVRVEIRPPGELDARLVNPNIYGFGRGRPLLLIKQAAIDFPGHHDWHLTPPAAWAQKLASRSADEPLRVDAIYDFTLTDCAIPQGTSTLLCKARFDDIKVQAGPIFDRATPGDKRLSAEIQGSIEGF
ncbi:hypothetical protein [Endozoicomonas sp. G2_2]|uniref:hypothetical protein n=1 Tax=Endozoicomonas sp. G2_2 TaxID=2821092 RepID=UPI001AD994E0|nr:hypothetical protein [Endozoicomonas sp. G2_2]